ncbi:MAG: glycosyl transferase family protein [Acidobacteriota bacterium]|nr:glycosyl transferase family protein [Acidobacteriota bacterium]
MHLDRWIAAILPPLVFWILLNGLDDLIVDAVWLVSRFFPRKDLNPPPGTPERPVAIFIPLWREHRVIRAMVEHNIGAQKYEQYDIFIGAYPNDAPTLAALADLETRFKRVHIAACPHDGPTSKADCLNWIYQRMLLHEELHGVHFETIVTHDAEDLIYPEALRLLNYHTRRNGMVQIPVLALPTPWHQLTHGVYCDEFAQFQFRDMEVRNLLGGFIPSNGVGTGFSREAIEALAAAYGNRIFEPACLTEDYENGYRVHRLGFPQLFIPLTRIGGSFAATREFFPRRFRAAVKQRTRWTTGIALQSWEHHGWRETMAQLWWFWRDRKGLFNNLLTPAFHLLTFYGLLTWGLSIATHAAWVMDGLLPPALNWCLAGVEALQLAIRSGSSACIYGWRFALTSPLRVIWGNWINFLASTLAVSSYASARIRGVPLAWLKTEHAYPNRAMLLEEMTTAPHLDALPAAQPLDDMVSLTVTRSFPAAVARRWKVLPFKVSAGHLHIAGVEHPTDEMHLELAGLCSLEIRFHRISVADYEQMCARYLPALTPLLEDPESTAG